MTKHSPRRSKNRQSRHPLAPVPLEEYLEARSLTGPPKRDADQLTLSEAAESGRAGPVKAEELLDEGSSADRSDELSPHNSGGDGDRATRSEEHELRADGGGVPIRLPDGEDGRIREPETVEAESQDICRGCGAHAENRYCTRCAGRPVEADRAPAGSAARSAR